MREKNMTYTQSLIKTELNLSLNHIQHCICSQPQSKVLHICFSLKFDNIEKTYKIVKRKLQLIKRRKKITSLF